MVKALVFFYNPSGLVHKNPILKARSRTSLEQDSNKTWQKTTKKGFLVTNTAKSDIFTPNPDK
jgi:hypothetical protein